ncbi:MAG: hypothetical protein R6X20_04030 [Phycisphaerae bacterium]
MRKRPALVLLAVFLAATACRADKKKSTLPPAGTTYSLSADYPRYVTADIEFRDAAGKKWPTFAYGKPADGGTFVYDPSRPKASFALVCDRMCQPRGDQSRRILGETIVDEKPPVITFTVKSLGPMRTETIEYTDRKGRTKTREETCCDADAVLAVGSHAVPVKARFTIRIPGRHEKETAYLEATFTVTGRALGLKAPGSTGPIEVRAAVSAYPTKTAPPKKKR